MASVSAGWKLSEAFRPQARAATYLRASPDPLALAGFDTASRSAYVGAELSLGLALRPLSDLSLSANGGVFFPDAGGSFASGTPATLRLRVDAGISL
jgi:hypothetical protein